MNVHLGSICRPFSYFINYFSPGKPRWFVILLAWGTLAAHSQQTNLAIVVRHAPDLNGSGLVDGTVQQLLGENLKLNGGFTLTGDLLVPGTPTLRVNGNPTFAGTIVGGGSASPSGYQITLNGNCSLNYLRTRNDPVTLPTIAAPPQPAGTRSVSISSAGQSIGDPATLRNLTLNGSVGQYAIPPGRYGNLIANGGSGFVLGVAGSSVPAIYNLQNLTLNGQSRLEIVGPVILTVANGFAANGILGGANQPSWLQLQLASGGFTLNGGCTVYGSVTAPAGTVIVDGNSLLVGLVQCDRLTVNSGGIIRAGASANQPPVATAQNLSMVEDTALRITLTGTDPEGSSLTYAVLSQPGHGVLSGTAPNLTYLPTTNYNGFDSFTFKVNDGQVDSATATISITVAPLNDPPLAQAQTVSIPEDTPLDIVLTGSDVENSPLTFVVVTPPAHGSLSGTPPNLIYTPATNYDGADSFTFKADDGQSQSTAATVSIIVSPVDDAPVAINQTLTTLEDTSVNVTLTAVDVEGDGLEFTILTQPAHGNLSGTPPDLVYTPATNYNGGDTFTFSANDLWLESAPATINLVIQPVNDVPVANPQVVTTAEDTATNIVLTASDMDGDTLSFELLSNPANGTLHGTPPNLVFSPAANLNGTNMFSFVAIDGSSTSAPVTVTLIITPVNDPPTVEAMDVSWDEDTATPITLTGTDVDGDALVFTVTVPPTNGVLSGMTPNLIYTPNNNFNGTDCFSYVANDGTTNSTPALVSITVNPVNDAPIVLPQNITTAEDTPVAVTLSGNDVDGDSLTFSVHTPPAHGNVSGVPPNLTYVPATNYFGGDSFTSVANDGLTSSSPATISITITPVNDAPIAQNLAISSQGGQPVTGTLTASDADGDVLTFSLQTQAGKGSAIVSSNGGFTYTPQAGVSGTDSFVFRVADGAAFATATVTVTLSSMNHVPVVQNQSVTTDEDLPIVITLNGSDADNDVLAFEIVSGPSQGTYASGIYTPATNFYGTDRFEYLARDGWTNSATATVTVTVDPVNDPPELHVPGPQTIIRGTTLPFDFKLPVLVEDPDHNGGMLRLSVAVIGGTVLFDFSDGYDFGQTWPLNWISDENNPTNPIVEGTLNDLNVALNGWGHLRFVSPPDLTRGVITLTVDDLGNSGAGGGKSDTKTIQITAANVPPMVSIATPASASQIPLGEAVPVTVFAADVDGTVTSVRLFLDGETLAEWPTPPYSLVWSNAALGDHVFFATAVDDKEARAVSPNLRVAIVESGMGDYMVNAGADQNIEMGHAAMLNGVLAISNPEFGTETNVLWSKVTGPGEVVFSMPDRLTTKAAFSKPGDYVLILRVQYAGGMRSDTLKVAVLPEPPEHLAAARSNKGTDFWLTFLYQPAATDYGIFNTVMIAATADTEVLLIDSQGRWEPEIKHIFVAAGTVTNVPVRAPTGWWGEDGLAGQVNSNTVRVIASAPVAVYGFTRESATADGYLALPTAMLGTNYILMSYPGASTFAFVAAEDNTRIRVVPTAPLENRSAGLQPQPVGQPWELVLQRGQAYRLEAWDRTSDYTGSSVASDKPIAVFSGAVNPYVPTNCGYADHLVEQLTPVNTWGKYFATMPLATRIGDTFRFLASADGTRVAVNGEVVAVLNRGQYHEQILTNAATILATQPILVAQFANGQDFDATTGDPFMMLLPPVEQFGGDYVLNALSLAGSRHFWEDPYWGYNCGSWFGCPDDDPSNPGLEYQSYINLLTFGNGAGTILLDGSLIPANQFQAIGDSGYFGAQLAVSNGNHRLTAPAPFGVSIYGWAPYESYAFLGGVYTESIEADTQLSLAQATPFAAVGTKKSVVAHISNGRGAPIPDVEVAFSTSGEHNMTGRVRTSRFGDAVFSYPGTKVGIDVITASLGDRQQSVSNEWIVATDNTPPLINTTNTAALQYGLTVRLSGIVSDAEQSIAHGLYSHWRLVEGPGAAIIANADQSETLAVCPLSGLYVFEFSADDGQFSSQELVAVRVDLLPGIQFPKPYMEIPSLVVVGSDVQLTSEAWDADDQIDRVEFHANGTLLGIATNFDWSTGYGLRWNPVTNGSFDIQAIAFDRWGGAATSGVATVLATYAPNVVIDNISNGTVVTVPTNLLIHAHAHDLDGSIASLSVFVNGELYGTTTNNSDLSATWFPRRQGDYTLSAVAMDNLGISTASENISVTVTGVFPSVVITNPVPVGFAFETPYGKPVQLAVDASVAAPYTITNVVITAYDTSLSIGQTPYQIDWTPQQAGIYYQLVAEAYADSGAIGTSPGVYIHTFVDASVSFAKPRSQQTVYVGRPQQLQMELRDPWNILEQNVFDFYLSTGWLSSDYLGRTTNTGVFNWTPPAPGDYSLVAVGSPFYFWASVSVTAIAPPPIENVTLVSPADGATLFTGINTPLAITFDDSTNAFDHWQGFANGAKIGSSTNVYLNWIPVITNDYVLTAIVYDHAGNPYNSTNSVTVHAVPPPRPMVTITYPAEGSRMRANAETVVIASLNDPASITTNVQFFVDGALAHENSTYFSWTPSGLGSHEIHAVALTFDGENVASAPVYVTVAEMYPPVVTLRSPANGQRFASGTLPTFSAQASDADGTISNLTLTLDYSTLGETNGATLEATVTNITPGWHEAVAQTVDNDGLSSASVLAQFFVERTENLALPVPQQLGALALSASEIQLSWLPIATNESTQSILVERWNFEASLWSEVAKLPITSTNYLDSSLNPETSYRYRIACTDTNGNRSAFANETNATTRTVVPNYAVIDLSAAVSGILTNRSVGGNILTNTGHNNYDVRRTVALDSRHAAFVLGTNYAALSRAIARFSERWPEIQLDLDPILLSPHSVMPRSGFLTGPGGAGETVSATTASMFDPADPARPVKAFLHDHQALFGFGPEAIMNATVERDYVSPVTGAHTFVWHQQVAGIPVFNARFISHVTATGELAAISSDFIPAPTLATDSNVLAAVLAGQEFPVSNPQALLTAVTNVGDMFDLTDVTGESTAQGVVRQQTYTGSTGIKGEAHVELTWFPASRNELKLARQVIFTSQWRNEMYLTLISVTDDQILYRRSLTADSSDATYNVFGLNSPAPMSPGLPVPGTAQAPVGNRSLLTFAALDAIASPEGWIPDGANETRGNNVDAHLDRNDDDLPDLPRPFGNPARVFDFSLDLNGNPTSYGDAATGQLFYWNNWMHDALYVLGFDEASGNFQDDNFNRGGVAHDAVIADAQDGASLNDGRHHDNANMSTPPDGYAPRMQMYTFTGAEPDRDGSLDAEIILHEYTHGLSARLIGGGAGIDALQTAGLGEGWSDFFALALLTEPARDADAAYPMGAYLTYHGFGSSFEENYYFGIRRYPYCTDTNKNPLTFADIDPTRASAHAGVPRSPLAGPFNPAMAGEVHHQGEVWAVMLWELRANLIRKHGAEPGHNLTLQLVTEGLRLSPANPNFVQARDAILLADRVLTDGANAAELWAAFTKRGLGYGAKVPYAYTTSGVTESYTPPPALVIEQVQIQGGNGNGIIETNEDNSLLITVRNQGAGPATGVSVQLATTTPGVQLLAAQAAYDDIPSGQSRGNNVLLQLRTLSEFVDGTTINLNVMLTSDQHTATTTVPFYTGGSGQSLPDNGNNGGLSTLPTSGTAAMRDLTPWDLGNLEPLWMADDASCLLKAGTNKYVLWKPDGSKNVIENTRYTFLAHRLTRHGVVVGTVIEPDTTDEAGNKVRHSWGAWWNFATGQPVPLTASQYSWPKNAGPLSFYGSVYSTVVTNESGEGIFITNVTSYPTLQTAWDLNRSGIAVGSVSMQDTFALQRLLFDPLGNMDWHTESERGLDAGIGRGEWATQTAYWAQLTTAAQFDSLLNWRWLGPLNWDSTVSYASLINDAGMVAGSAATLTGNPALDFLRPTHAFRAPAAGEAGPFLTLATDLGALPGGLHSQPYAMNQAGDLVGRSDYGTEANNYAVHAVYWSATSNAPTDLGYLEPVPVAPQGSSEAYDLNDNQQIVGTSLRIDPNSGSTTQVGVLWQWNEGTNALSGWEINELNSRRWASLPNIPIPFPMANGLSWSTATMLVQLHRAVGRRRCSSAFTGVATEQSTLAFTGWVIPIARTGRPLTTIKLA